MSGGKVAHDSVGFHFTGGGDILLFHSFNTIEGWDGLSFGYLLSKC